MELIGIMIRMSVAEHIGESVTTTPGAVLGDKSALTDFTRV